MSVEMCTQTVGELVVQESCWLCNRFESLFEWVRDFVVSSESDHQEMYELYSAATYWEGQRMRSAYWLEV